MASENRRLNFDRREYTTTDMGHDMIWYLSVSDLVYLQSRPWINYLRINCKNNPTTWRFEMSLPELREDGTCSLSVLLTRMDNTNLDMEGVIWIDICDRNENLIYRKQTFTRTGMLEGDVIQETVEMTPLPNMRDEIHRNPMVIVTIMVCFCHEDFESD